jgi:mRNA interferase MazF
MPSTTSFRQGDIVLVPFPFTDLSGAKQRPALVISPERLNNKRPDLVVVALTSQIPAAFSEDEVFLSADDLAAGGLPKQSIVRLGKVFTIHQALIRKKLGQLPETTVKTILQKVKQSLDD